MNMHFDYDKFEREITVIKTEVILEDPRITSIKNSLRIGIKNRQHLQFIYDRLINVHKENPNVDYMAKFKEIIDQL